MKKLNLHSVVAVSLLLGSLSLSARALADNQMNDPLPPQRAEGQQGPDLGAAEGSTGNADVAGLEGKRGVSLSELKQIVPDLKIKQEGREIYFTGSIPQRCVDQNTTLETPAFEDGVHKVTIILSDKCTGSPSRSEPKLSLSEVLGKRELSDATGDIVLRYFNQGDVNDRDREIKTDKIGHVVSEGDRLAAEAAERARVEEEDRIAKDKATRDSIVKFCKDGNFNAARNMAAEGLLEDIDDVLSTLRGAELAEFKTRLKNVRNSSRDGASSEEEMMSIFREFLAAEREHSWGKDAVKDMFDILRKKRQAIIADATSEVKSNEDARRAATKISAWRTDLRDLYDDGAFDASENPRQRYKDIVHNEIYLGYKKLGDRVAENSDPRAAAEFYELAKDNARDEKMALEIDNELVAAYGDAFKACLEKQSPEACEKKYGSKAKRHADRIAKHLEAGAKTEDGAEAYQEFMSNYTTTFGAGPQYYWTGYGRSTPYMPGSMEQMKIEAIRNQQQMMMQQMYGGGMGGMNMMGGGMNGMMGMQRPGGLF